MKKLHCKGINKLDLLRNIRITQNPYIAMIFCNTRECLDEFYKYFKINKYYCDRMHGAMEKEREQGLWTVYDILK